MLDVTPLPATSLPAAEDVSACCTPTTGTVLGEQEVEQLARMLKALADPTRLRLLSIIAAHQGGEVCVCDLTAPVGLSQPTVSHHLKVLAEAGLVTRDKRGVWAYYTAVPDAVARLSGHLLQHLGGVADPAGGR